MGRRELDQGEENGKPEHVPGIDIIVSIPSERLRPVFPQSVLAPKYSFPLSQESPKDGLLSPDPQSPGQEDPKLR